MVGDRPGAAATWASAHVAARNVRAAVSRWGDPRRRLLRKRRTARRATLSLGGVTGVFTVSTLALASADVNAVFVAGSAGLTAMVAVPTVAVAVRLRRLLRVPLPAERVSPAVLPPMGSAAREPLRRLAAAEASLQELVGLLDRDVSVPSSEVGEAGRAAGAAGRCCGGRPRIWGTGAGHGQQRAGCGGADRCGR